MIKYFIPVIIFISTLALSGNVVNQPLQEKKDAISQPVVNLKIDQQAVVKSTKAATKITEQIQKAQKVLKKVEKSAGKILKAFELSSEQSFPPFESKNILLKESNGKSEIPVCESASLEGKNSIIGSQIHSGMQIVFDNISTDIPDSKYYVRLFSTNNGSEPHEARTTIKSLQINSPIFLSFMGDDVLFSSLSYLVKNHLLAIFPVSGIEHLRMQSFRNLVFFRPSYEKEIEALVNYLFYRLRKKKVAIFYEESDWGNTCRQVVVNILKKCGLRLVAQASYSEGTVDVSEAVTKISKKGPSAVFCIAHPRPASTFVRFAINKGLYNAVFLGTSELVSIQKVLKKSRGARVITSSVVPNPLLSTIPIVQKFRDAMNKYLQNQAISPFHLEGFINATLFIKVLNMIVTPITTENIISVFENMQKFDLDGLVLNFDKTTRTLSNQVWINRGEELDYLSASSIKMDD